jgi:diguanylate cyclase (GGDEF)-like protein
MSDDRSPKRSTGGAVLTALALLLPAAISIAALGWVIANDAPAWTTRLVLGLAGVSVIVNLVLGLTGAARRRSRLNQMIGAVRKLAARDFAIALPARGRDGIAELGGAIDKMGLGLGRHCLTLRTLSQIDKAALSDFEPDDAVRLALPCIATVAGPALAVLALEDPSAPSMMHFSLIRSEDPGRIERSHLPLDMAARARVLAYRVSDASGPLPLPAPILMRLRTACGENGAAAVLPVGSPQRARGFVVLGFPRDTVLGSDQLEQVGSLLARIDGAWGRKAQVPDRLPAAHLDALTGLPNRPALVAALAAEFAHAQRNRTRIAVLVLDLDRFKQTNDALGHAAGDELLRAVADRIRATAREEDVVARPGGDEFAIVLSGLLSWRDSSGAARNLIQALSRPFDIGGQTIYLGASVGIAIYPEDARDAEDLLKKADTAMYRAKDEGRSRFAYFEESMNLETRRRVALGRELRQAFERSEFVLHYQPQIDVRTGRICTVEALVRWRHPEQGLLGPSTFIPFAEENGLIDAIGTWVLKEACLQYQRWRAQGISIPRIAVNVSIEQLRRSNFVRTVEQALYLAEMPADRLEIEVTESMFLQRGKAAMNAMSTLSQGGVVFAIDDFGSGYASFGYLKTLHAQVIKLDQSFIADATTNADSGTIVAAMVNMAHTLKREVVAEGVETRDQLEFLTALGCEKVQGFLFSRALPPDEFARFALSNAAQAPAAERARPSAAARQRAVAATQPPQDEWLTVPFVGVDL